MGVPFQYCYRVVSSGSPDFRYRVAPSHTDYWSFRKTVVARVVRGTYERLLVLDQPYDLH